MIEKNALKILFRKKKKKKKTENFQFTPIVIGL